MEKNNQPLIFGIVVIGAVLIIALALIFTRGGDETTTETTGETNTTDNQEDTSTGENGEDGQQPQPTPDPIPTPQPIPEPQPQPQPTPEPSDGLPSNWQSLTSQQKTELNPFACDHETQWVSAEDGSCIERSPAESTPEFILLHHTIINAADDEEAQADCLRRCDLLSDLKIGTYHIIASPQMIDRSNVIWVAFVDFEVQLPERDDIWYPRYVFYADNGSRLFADYSEADVIDGWSSKPLPVTPLPTAGCPAGWIELPDGNCIIEN